MPITHITTLDQLSALHGQEAVVSDWIDVSQERINQFADATGDHQWIHVDVERARRESPFGAPIAHGFLTLSLLAHLMESSLKIDLPAKLGVNYGLNKVRFVSPVPAGSRIRARAVLQSLDEVAGGQQITWAITVEREGAEKPALVAEWLVRRYF